MGRVMRACVNTVGFIVIRTEVACRGLGAYLGDFSPRTSGIVGLHLEGMHIDISVGTVAGAQAATDAPVLNCDFKTIPSADRSDRAPHHAQGVFALAARRSHEVVVQPQAIADQTADAVVRIRASPHALVASRTSVEIQHQQTLRFHQSLGQERVHGDILNLLKALAIFRDAVPGHGLKTSADLRKALQHEIEILEPNAHRLHVVQRGAGGSPNSATEQREFARKNHPARYTPGSGLHQDGTR